MSLSRSISWNAAIRDLKSDRVIVPVGMRTARALCEGYFRFRQSPLAVAGNFDRAAVMSAAVSAAKAHQLRHGGTWQAAMSVCLKAAWQAAKTARRATAH